MIRIDNYTKKKKTKIHRFKTQNLTSEVVLFENQF